MILDSGQLPARDRYETQRTMVTLLPQLIHASRFTSQSANAGALNFASNSVNGLKG